MSIPTYDDTRFPVVTIVIADDGMSIAEIDAHAAKLEGYAKRGPFAMVIDQGKSPMPSAAERAKLAESIRSLDRSHPTVVRGAAIVVRNPIHRGLMTAVLWLVRPAQPLAPFATREEALAWALRLFDDPVRPTGSVGA